MTDAEHIYDQQRFREAQFPRGRVAEVIEFHPDIPYVDPVIIFDAEAELFDDLE